MKSRPAIITCVQKNITVDNFIKEDDVITCSDIKHVQRILGNGVFNKNAFWAKVQSRISSTNFMKIRAAILELIIDVYRRPSRETTSIEVAYIIRESDIAHP
jgi:hypothetical protein